MAVGAKKHTELCILSSTLLTWFCDAVEGIACCEG